MLFVGFFFVVVCGNFVFLFRMYSSIWYYCFDVCIPLLHAVAAVLFSCFAFASKWWWVSLHQNKSACCYRSVCVVGVFVWICPNLLLLWIGILIFFLLSLSLTKLSMENKCGSYILQNINKNSQVVPKIFFFCIF